MTMNMSRASRRVDTDKLINQANVAIKRLEETEERRSLLEDYLAKRNGQNNFGEDFEMTFRSRERGKK